MIGKSVGNGVDQLKAQIVGWIRDEIRASQRGGIGVPLIGGVGSLGNDALTSPVVPGIGGASATGWAVSLTSTAKASVAIAIPTGFTCALVHVTCAATAGNPNSAGDALYVRASIALPGGATTNGSELYNVANPAGVLAVSSYTTAAASLAGNFSGLTPGVITVACQVRGGTLTWAANTVNLANVDASIIFLR